MEANSNQKKTNEKTHGEPCEFCGCPYYNDHTRDCPMVPTIPIIKRIDALVAQLRHQGLIQ